MFDVVYKYFFDIMYKYFNVAYKFKITGPN